MFNIPKVTNQYSSLIAYKINHKSKHFGTLGKLEQGHRLMLNALDAKPLPQKLRELHL
ncbi:hypothetical protein [Pseudoalteromonas arctica]|uniref:Uncharacterized protein n=1 Tax=Pseudoalteromonas arctica TaxID=394751 RepID=A0A7Y0H9W3_9GAMM|nr:hypothetical protein [Pseudoalteromonas arctica]NMM39996.1 hypothetical protein [Pseudoalteromonas arctica]